MGSVPEHPEQTLGLLRLCTICGKRPAKFKLHGKIKVDREHDVCLQCFRNHMESVQQQQRAIDQSVQVDVETTLEIEDVEEL